MRPEDIIARAAEVLRENDMGEWTRASPTLYPHQWSWDTAFIAIGLAHLDTGRAAREILTLLEHQWKNGKIPHIVFNPDAPPESYFPVPSTGLAPPIPLTPRPVLPLPAACANHRYTRSRPGVYSRSPRPGARASPKPGSSSARSTPSSSRGIATWLPPATRKGPDS